MKSLLEPVAREGLLRRFRALRPDSPRCWGRMTAPEMLAHLSDQMRHRLGDATTSPRRGLLRWPPFKQLVMFWLPWPKGRVRGPAEAFVTRPGNWDEDFRSFETLVARFVEATGRKDWPEHAFFGRMTRRSWGRFCHRHFDHHLRQFGV